MLLDIKVLDPAMGSGHFLVEAVDFVTDRVIEILDTYPDCPLLKEIEHIRRDIIDGLAASGIRIEVEKLTDTNLLKRMVMKRCIYGVDLNLMAVELAKLSLWLDSFTLGAPLSFLDHHLKCGNSLVGANVAEVRDRLKSASLFGNQFAGLLTSTQLMQRVGELTDSTFAEVQESANLYERANLALAPFKGMLDLWVSEHFGNKGAQRFLSTEVENPLENPQRLDSQGRELVAEAINLRRSKRFFHWELEFPEAFYDKAVEKDNPGFDAVIGNPPYGASFDKFDKQFIQSNYISVKSILDSFGLFIEKSLKLSKEKGLVGWITPSGWLTAKKHLPLRKFLLHSSQVPKIIHLPYDVFPDAYIDTIIFIASNCSKQPISVNQNSVTLVKRYPIREGVSDLLTQDLTYEEHLSSKWNDNPYLEFMTSLGEPEQTIRHKMGKMGTPFTELVEISRGITPFIETENTNSDGVRLGFFGSIGRYSLEPTKYIHVVYDQSLLEFKPEKFLKGPRLILRRIISRQHRIHCTYASDDFVINKSYLPVISKNPAYSLLYFLALLNSALFSHYFVTSSEIAKRDDFPQLDIASTSEFPIRSVLFTTIQEERQSLLSEGIALYQQHLDTKEYRPLLDFIAKRLSASPEQSDVIHDLLAHLAQQMLEMNKARQEEIKGFLKWLTREIGTEIDPLNNKTIIKDYHTTDFEQFLTVIKKNRIYLGIDPNVRTFQDRLETEYDRSLNILIPLKQKISSSDKLIDKIIYQLYHLTEAEINIVEKSLSI